MSIFQTSDADMAAYLFARAYPVLKIARQGEVTVFIFPREASVSAEAYYHGATIPAKNLLHAARQLDSKRRIVENEYASV